MKHLCAVILTAICLSLCGPSDVAVNGERAIFAGSKLAIDASKNVDQYWTNLTTVLEDYAREKSLAVYSQWKSAIERGDLKSKITKPCLDVIEHIIRRPLDEEWTARMIDSLGTVPSGVLSGSTTSLGDYDQCIAIDGTFRGNSFVGTYCLATVNLPRTDLFKPSGLNRSALRYEWLGENIENWYNNDNYYAAASAVCFPSICRADEIRDILLSYYEVLNSFEFNVTYCQSRAEPYQYDSRIWIALSILAIPCLFIIPGTVVEFFYGSAAMSSLLGQVLLSFSFISNTRVLFRMVDTRVQGNTQFQFVHGIRAIAAVFIVIAHSSGLVNVLYQMPVSIIARHPTDVIAISKQAFAQPFYNGALVVATFFLISGMFLTFWTASAKKLRMSFPEYVILRWLRYTPPLIGMLCLTVCLEFLGTGPAFQHDLLWPTLEPCYNGWLSHLLFFSNYKDMDKTCGIQTWYISVEMQLHIAAFLFLLAYTRSRRLAFWVAVSFIALGMSLVVFFVAIGRASIPLVQVIVYTQFAPTHDAVRYIFFSPTMNMIPYFLGILIGQMLLENRIVRFSKSTTGIVWALVVFVLVALPMSSYSNADDLDLIPGNASVSNAVAFSVIVLIWSLANGWLVYQCVINPNLPLTRFLSAKFFQPFSRLSFCMYLCHLMCIWFNAFQTRTTISVISLHEIYKGVSVSLLQSIFLAYILYITFEAPSVNLIKILMNRDAKQKAKEEKNNNNNNNTVTEKANLAMDRQDELLVDATAKKDN